jgi:hypothetical protein
MSGNKTHDQQIRTFERKDALPKARDRDAQRGAEGNPGPAPNTGASDHRVGAFPSRTNRESRDHNKHNNPGQEGHGLQKHRPSEEKS